MARWARAGEVALDTASTLVRRARLGEHEAFLALVREHQDRVFRLAWLLLPDESVATEATLDAFVRAEASLRRRAERGPFFALVARDLLRRVRDERNRTRARRGSAGSWASKAGSEATAAALASLRTLGVDDAAALALRYVLAVSDAEAFAALGCSRRELERRAARALVRFRTLYAERQPSLPARQGTAGEPDAHRSREALAALASEAPMAPPGLTVRVERQLEEPARTVVRSPWPLATVLAVLTATLAGFALAVGLLAASDAARERFHVGPAGVPAAPSPAPSPTTVSTPTLVAVRGFARPSTLEEARRLAPFPLMFPQGWAGPDAVYIWEPEPGNPVVILSYLDGGFDLYEGPLAATFEEPPAELAQVQVDGTPARWLEGGAIVLHYIDADGRPVVERKRIVDRNTLVWERSGVPLRMETSRALPFALAIASAVR